MNHLFSLPLFYLSAVPLWNAFFPLCNHAPSITEGSQGRSPSMHHLSTAPPFPAFLFPVFPPLNQSSGWRMVTVRWLHSTPHFWPPPCLPQVTLLNTAVSGGVNCFSIYFSKGFSLCCFAVSLWNLSVRLCLSLSFALPQHKIVLYTTQTW